MSARGHSASASSKRGGKKIHHLYVVVNGTKKSLALTIQILQFMNQRKLYLEKLNIKFEVNKIDARLLKESDKLRRAFVTKGIKQFPAVKTSMGNIRLGVENIIKLYSNVIEDFKKYVEESGRYGETQESMMRRGVEIGGSATYDDMYRNFFAKDLSIGSKFEGEDTLSGGTDNMMAKFTEIQRRRNESNKQRQNDQDYAYLDKKDNHYNKKPSGAAPSDEITDHESNAAIDRLISTLAGPVDESTLKNAFGGSENAQDDMMVSAFWQNQSESI